MRFKIDENLNVVAAAKVAPVDPETVAVKLCARFIDAGMIEDTPDYFGETVSDAMGMLLVRDVRAILSGYLYGDSSRSIHCDIFEAFCRLIIMGDGNCPHCGGKLKYIETIGHELKDGDYDTPNSYIVDHYIYQCPVCGETIKSDKDL